MRKIKFRAWDDDGKRMIGPFEVGSHSSLVWLPQMQYTGKKDENKKEIYEGDIVQFVHSTNNELNKTGVIIWNHKDCMFRIKCIELDYWNPSLNDPYLKYYIIGNIHENPELLESK